MQGVDKFLKRLRFNAVFYGGMNAYSIFILPWVDDVWSWFVLAYTVSANFLMWRAIRWLVPSTE